MTVQNIYQAVRCCYDEEAQNNANFVSASAGDMALMNNIIKAKIGDALRWICLYAPAELLGGSDETSDGTEVPTGILVDMPASGTLVPTTIAGTTGGYITTPANFIKLARIRVAGWHRAIKSPIEEDSEEYLQLYDENGATATAERPQAAIINKATKVIEVWPTGVSVQYTYVAEVNNTSAESDTDGTTVIAIPPRAKTAFIYYLAFLVLSAYGDSLATRMLEIAKMNLGLTDDKQRA